MDGVDLWEGIIVDPSNFVRKTLANITTPWMAGPGGVYIVKYGNYPTYERKLARAIAQFTRGERKRKKRVATGCHAKELEVVDRRS